MASTDKSCGWQGEFAIYLEDTGQKDASCDEC